MSSAALARARFAGWDARGAAAVGVLFAPDGTR